MTYTAIRTYHPVLWDDPGQWLHLYSLGELLGLYRATTLRKLHLTLGIGISMFNPMALGHCSPMHGSDTLKIIALLRLIYNGTGRWLGSNTDCYLTVPVCQLDDLSLISRTQEKVERIPQNCPPSSTREAQNLRHPMLIMHKRQRNKFTDEVAFQCGFSKRL